MKLSKKTIMIILGISVAVVVLSLGVGLGVGLSSSSSPSSQVGTNPSGGGGYVPADIGPVYRVANYSFSADDIENNKSITINGKNYNVVQKDGKYYLNVPATNDLTLSSPTIIVPKMFNTTDQVVYNSLTSGEWGKGKDGYYQVDFMTIGAIKIINTTIYGGFEEVKDNQDNIIGYRVHNLLDSDTYPNGYQIGSFNADGGGINMLKLEKLKYLIDGDDSTTEENAPITTEFGFFPYVIFGSSKIVIKLLTSSSPENNLPENIGISLEPKSNIPLTTFPQDSWSDLDNEVEINSIQNELGHVIGYQERSSDLDFKIGYFKKRDGSDYKITLNQNDEVYATKEVPLDELYMPLKFEGGSYNHNVLGSIKQSRDGYIYLPNDFVIDSNEDRMISVQNFQFDLPNIKLELQKSVFNEENYATEATSRLSNELLINADSSYVEYFRKIANLPQVKNLAKKYGVTIRFKVNHPQDETELIKSRGVFDNSLSQVFFPSVNNVYDFNNKEMVAPLKFILKSNLENENYFIDRWRQIGKIGVEGNKDQYGLYPFFQSSQFIAYNIDYLPNGFDFTNKDLIDYLYIGDLGSLNTILQPIGDGNINDDQKTSLIPTTNFISAYGALWGSDYYSPLKKDQKELDWDLAWKAKNSKNDYYSALLDPNLKNDRKYQKWVDYFKNASDSILVGTDLAYDIWSLYNGRIGGIIPEGLHNLNTFIYGSSRIPGEEPDDEIQDFVLNKLRFQPIPGNGFSPLMRTLTKSSRVGAIISLLQNDKQKQEVAEMFIHMMTTNNNFMDLVDNLKVITPRKDINVENSQNKVAARLIKVMANSSINVAHNQQFLDYFYGAMVTSRNTLDYEKVIDDFKAYLSPLNYNILSPENP